MPSTFHPLAWLIWLAAAALPALSTRNPLYLSLALLAVSVSYVGLGRRSPLARSWNAFVRFGAFLWLLTIPFTALTSHYGEVVLFRLPQALPVVGGPITLEALLYGLTGGLALLTLLLVFATFNVAVDQARLLRMTPAFIYQAGVVAGIAVAFVPQMVASWQAIREAQQVRGHRVRGIRDLLPLILPLLVTALERAMQLAESMEARGFGGQATGNTAHGHTLIQAGLLLGLGALGTGLTVASFWPQQSFAAGLTLGIGGGLVLWSFWEQGRRLRRTRYHRWTWSRVDRIMLAISAVTALGWMGVILLAPGSLIYYPYPPYSPWPEFGPIQGLLIALLAAPGILMRDA